MTVLTRTPEITPRGPATSTPNSLKRPLAILGGEPSASQISCPPFPPVNEATAAKLGELYLGREWSFNGVLEQQFAAEFAAFHGAKFGIFMANGTVTLQCALAVHGVGAGDEVIVPAITWPASAMAALYLGAVPVFVDLDPQTLCMDAAAVEAAITSRTRAIMPVHLYGGMPDLEAILAIARKHGLVVVEDCAHAHGGMWNGRGVGSWGDVGSFSFQQTKTMASGEGGICLTSDEDKAELLFRAKHIGYGNGAKQGMYDSGPPAGLDCYNFRATEFQALILLDQLQGLEERIATYNRNALRLEERLREVPGVRLQQRGRLADKQSYYTLPFIFDGDGVGEVPLQRITAALAAEGVGLGHTYGPTYRHILWNVTPERYRVQQGGCPAAEKIHSRTAVLAHQWLYAEPETIDAIGDALAKVCFQAHLL